MNIGYSTIFKCIKPELDKVWYNDVQRSFLQRIRDKHLLHRYYAEVEMRRLADSRRAKDPENYLPKHLAVMDLKEGFEGILDKLKGNDLSEENLKWGASGKSP